MKQFCQRKFALIGSDWRRMTKGLITQTVTGFYCFLDNKNNDWKFSIDQYFMYLASNSNLIITILNIASGSEANITTPSEMEFFNFLWLIWDHYIPLAPTQKDTPPWDPDLGALHKIKSAPQFFLNSRPSLVLTQNLTYLRSRTLKLFRSKNWTLEVKKFPKLNFFQFFIWSQISYDKMAIVYY